MQSEIHEVDNLTVLMVHNGDVYEYYVRDNENRADRFKFAFDLDMPLLPDDLFDRIDYFQAIQDNA